jgi:hypothetical protein
MASASSSKVSAHVEVVYVRDLYNKDKFSLATFASPRAPWFFSFSWPTMEARGRRESWWKVDLEVAGDES